VRIARLLVFVLGLAACTPDKDRVDSQTVAPRRRQTTRHRTLGPKGYTVLDPRAAHRRWARKVEDPASGVVFVLVPPRTFAMGSRSREARPNEQPVREVTLKEAFYLAQTEVTVEQWARFVRETGYTHRPGGIAASLPQAGLCREDALAFCRQYGYRLPTEEEWEHASRAGTTDDRYGNLDDIAWHRGNTAGIRPAATREANAWELFDTLGSLWEWCESGVLRGGAFNEEGRYARAPDRGIPARASERRANFGFRPVRDANR